MGRLVYGMITSLDGYAVTEPETEEDGAEDGVEESGDPGDDAGDDAELHEVVGELYRDVGTYLYGRRMYETMVFWETAHELPGAPPYVVDFARTWQAVDKVVYSTTLQEVASARTRIERRFDPEAVRRLKAESEHDLTIDGPTLAAQAVRAGLVDEFHLFLGTRVAGGGTPFFPPGVRMRLELLEHRVLGSGTIWARYRPR